MKKLAGIEPEKVFKYFEEISAIPRGSGNMDKISKYCMEFANAHSLKALRDDANNVVIFKEASEGYEGCAPIILQGHLDMVCLKDEDYSIDFEKDGLELYTDGDFVKAKGTTLGADNGIAAAMILAILDSGKISHPPIEAVFTTDEEIGMIGAGKLDLSVLKGRRMINLDSENPSVLTVSCAGGSDFRMSIPVKREKACGRRLRLTIEGLKGGHSGADIDKGRVNANILMGRILNYAADNADFDIISLNGGEKGNAIPVCCTAELLVSEPESFISKTKDYINTIKREISEREENFKAKFELLDEGDFEVFSSCLRDKLIFMLVCAPCGVEEMSAEIEGLVETSLNLGILKTEEEKITLLFTLRSNKKSALEFLENKLKVFSSCIECKTEVNGSYPPWEYAKDSELRKLYKKAFKEKFGFEPKTEAIHAGLECGIFSSGLKGLDCISIGPEMHDIHTTKEELSISSTKDFFEILLNVLKECR